MNESICIDVKSMKPNDERADLIEFFQKLKWNSLLKMIKQWLSKLADEVI